MAVFAPTPRSLKFRMTGVVVMLVLIATMTVAWVALVLAERDMKSVIGDQQYALLSSAATQVDDQLTARRALLASLADIITDADGADTAGMQAFVARHPVVRGRFLNLHIYNREGVLLNTTPDGALALDPGDDARAYFQRTLAAGKPEVSPPFKSILTGRPAIMILQPVLDAKGRAVMLICGSIDLTSPIFMQQVLAYKPGQTGYNFLMTDEGILLYHPRQDQLLRHVNARPGRNIATDRALTGFQGWTETTGRDGTLGIFAYKRLQTVDWIIAARYPVAEAFAPMVSMRHQAMLAAALFAVVAGVMAWIAVHLMLRPLTRLRRQIGDIRDGSAGIDVLQRGRADEIGALSVAFHELMAEREAAQKASRDSEALISSILERAPDAFVSCEPTGIITKWNAAAERSFGWTHDEAVGRDIAELIVPPGLRDKHGAGMRSFANGYSGPLMNSRVRIAAMHKDGHEVPVELSLGALRHEGAYFATAFLHDITERVAYERQIAASEKRLRTIADSIPAMVAYIDRDLRYRFTNEHFRVMAGVDPQSMLGKTVSEVFGTALLDSLAPYHAAALAGERQHYERESHDYGKPRQIMADIIPDVGADGAVAGFYLMTLDITERKNAELRQAASEKRLKLLTDNLPVLISYLDHTRTFRFVNATFQHWFGMDPEKMIGDHLVQGVGKTQYALALPHLDRAYEGHIATYEHWARIDGVEHTLETTFVPEPGADGRVIGIYSLTHDTTRMKEIEQRLTQLARIDPLTGIANRLMFEEILQLAIVRARRNRAPLALAYLDIDHFKAINDTHGHGGGDAVLKEFAARLKANVRAADTVARIAGDEFVIVFEQVAHADEIARLALKIVEAIRQPFTVAGAPRRITTSIGLALHDSGGGNHGHHHDSGKDGDGDVNAAAELVARADSALYAAKHNGRDGYAIAD